MDDLIFVKTNELLIQPEIKWFENKFNKNEPTNFEQTKKLEVINAFREHARKLYEQDIANYNTFREKTRRSDHKWIQTVQKTGTIADKINANCVLIQDSAVHNMDSLENLIQSVKLSKKRECMLAIDALKDLFTNYLLPKRVLRSFHEHPFDYLISLTNDKQTRDKCLLLYYFESLIKVKYSNFIKQLQEVFQDTLETTKYKVASTLYELIVSNSFEQQRVLYEMMVNKLGDPDYKVASKIVYHINNYLKKCPKMKMNLLLEIERLVSRQNIKSRAQYYGFCCMNQLMLSRHDTEVANRLLIIYFSFFKKFIKNKEIDSRMLNALLTGVNRAYKYAKMDHEEIDKNLNTLFKLVHVTSFNVSIQALMLLNQVMESRDDMINRYFNALYRRMFDLEWRNTSKQTYFLNLLYNSLIKDESLPRIKAFVKRLLQICFSQNVPFVCGSFMLISEILKVKKNIFQLDHSLLIKNALTANVNHDGIGKFEEDDDEEEKFVDVKDETDEETEKNGKNHEGEEEQEKNETIKSTSWVHKTNIVFKRHDKYDFRERNPLYCGADKTLTYELFLFTKHYHPTVVVFANKLMDNEPVEYTGDPMEDFTLMHFLDRFVYKNPKKTKNGKTNGNGKKSVFEPVKSIYKSKIKNLAVNSEEYLKLDISEIPEEEKFFYNYYKSQQNKKPLVNDIESDADSVSDSEFDAYLMKTEVDGADANDDWGLDFAEGVSKDKKNKKKKKKDEEEEEEDIIESDFDDEDDEELFEKELREEMSDDDDDDDEEEDDEFNEDGEADEDNFDDIDEDDGLIMMKKPNKKNRGKEDLSKLFVAADEFSDMINESMKYDEMGVGSISNTDNANPKQLKWELQRDEKLNGKKWKSIKKNKNFSKKTKKSSSNVSNKKVKNGRVAKKKDAGKIKSKNSMKKRK